ncbi:hypothetical protein [Enteractinococcus helveticum]|uniref:hypothetical protein n=1 Tax=Enteractinococcus helveticum TaxID=1837282 RepID=UPI000ABD7970|nr:hypothetical protein [Enteractinococcus helveticum]
MAEVLDTVLPESAAEDSVSSLDFWRGQSPSARTDEAQGLGASEYIPAGLYNLANDLSG